MIVSAACPHPSNSHTAVPHTIASHRPYSQLLAFATAFKTKYRFLLCLFRVLSALGEISRFILQYINARNSYYTDISLFGRALILRREARAARALLGGLSCMYPTTSHGKGDSGPSFLRARDASSTTASYDSRRWPAAQGCRSRKVLQPHQKARLCLVASTS